MTVADPILITGTSTGTAGVGAVSTTGVTAEGAPLLLSWVLEDSLPRVLEDSLLGSRDRSLLGSRDRSLLGSRDRSLLGSRDRDSLVCFISGIDPGNV